MTRTITRNTDCQVFLDGREYPCPISMIMDLIGGKWRCVILYYLKDGEKRFSELRKDMPQITEMTLSLQLKKLENDGLITRVVFGDKPPLKVIYALSPFGDSFRPILESVSQWAKDQVVEI